MLELGCGNSPDALQFYVTNAAVGARYIVPFLIGIDHDFAALRHAERSSIHLLQADIAYLPFHMQFDLVIVRHPDIDRHASVWQKALIHGPDLLNKNGILLVTTYSLPEFEQAKGLLASSKLVDTPLETKHLAPPGLQGRDRFILCWRNS